MAKPYASYRRYKSDWLPELPAHWERRRIKFLTTFMVSGERQQPGLMAIGVVTFPGCHPRI
jgi:hypothetical protein